MNKKIIASFMLLFIAFLAGCDNQATPQSEKTQTGQITEAIKPKVDKIEIIDFHSNQRCFSCKTIEKFTQLTLEEFYQPQMRDGKITFQSINVEEPQNQALVQKYQARGSSLFINPIVDGKDNILEDTQVWRLVSNEAGFKQYLKNKIDNLLK